MPEPIDAVEHSTPAVFIWNLMCEHCVKAGHGYKIDKAFPGLAPGNTIVQAELIVNGVSLPVMDSLNHYWFRAEAELDKRARKMAEDMLKGTALQSVMDRLSAIEWEINEELDKIFPNTVSKDH